MKDCNDCLENLIERYPALAGVRGNIAAAFEILKASFGSGGKLLIAGNGGSAADAEHITGELMKGFLKRRPLGAEIKESISQSAGDEDAARLLAGKLQGGLPVIALTGNSALSTAFLNDVEGELVFAQQVCGYGRKGDVLLAISTSGNSQNVIYAMITASAKGLKNILLSGNTGGRALQYADAAIVVPGTETYKIQELHLPVYHTLCLMLEEYFF